MNSSQRTLEITVPIEAIKPYYESILHTLGKIKPTEELLKLEISPDWKAPWYESTDVPLRLTIRNMKEVSRTEINGQSEKSI